MSVCEECGSTYRVRKTKSFGKILCNNCHNMYKSHPVNQIPPNGEIRYDDEGRPICHICGRAFDKLGQHVYNRHDMSADEYKEKFGLDRRVGLTSDKTKKKLQDAVKDNYSLVVEKNLLNNGKKTRFDKNNKARTKEKVRLQTYKRLCERTKKMNKLRVLKDKEDES